MKMYLVEERKKNPMLCLLTTQYVAKSFIITLYEFYALISFIIAGEKGQNEINSTYNNIKCRNACKTSYRWNEIKERKLCMPVNLTSLRTISCEIHELKTQNETFLFFLQKCQTIHHPKQRS